MAVRNCIAAKNLVFFLKGPRRRIEGGGFDETQWDPYASEKDKKITWENGHTVHDIEARDRACILQKVGRK
jgi:hypothetical protein